MQNTSQRDYLRIWKWSLALECLILAVLGFSFNLWCGFSTLIVWATTNFFLFREVARSARAMRLVMFCLVLVVLDALAFVLPCLLVMIWNNWSAGVQTGKFFWPSFGPWSLMFAALVLFALFNKVLIFFATVGVRKILEKRASA